MNAYIDRDIKTGAKAELVAVATLNADEVERLADAAEKAGDPLAVDLRGLHLRLLRGDR